MNDLNDSDMDVFVEAINHYFTQTTQESAQIRAAYLGDDGKLPIYDFTGAINVSGEYFGTIYFSAPNVMLRHLLTMMKESDQSRDNLLDIVGEIANTLSGNARKYFGETLKIAPPIKMDNQNTKLNKLARQRPYVISIKWKHYMASLIVDVAKQ
jgi:chemotaxis protein CheX